MGERLARQESFLALLQNFYLKPPEGQDCIDIHEEWGRWGLLLTKFEWLQETPNTVARL